MRNNQYFTKSYITNVYLYGSPPFSMIYYNPKKKRFIAIDLQLIRPDPRIYLHSNKIYNGYISEVGNIISIKIDGKLFYVIY